MVTRAVIVAAGYGSRLLPITRCIPKEMLPLLDRPAIDFVVQELVDAGITDVLVSNEVRDLVKIDRLARLPKRGARVIVCVDDPANVAELSEAARRHGTLLQVLVEIDCGQGRCGVTTPDEAVALGAAVQAGVLDGRIKQKVVNPYAHERAASKLGHNVAEPLADESLTA